MRAGHPRGVLAAFVGVLLALAVAHTLSRTLAPVAVLTASAVPVATFGWQLARGRALDTRAWWLMLAGSSTLLLVDLSTVLSREGLDVPYVHGVALVGALVGYLLLLAGGSLATVPVVRSDPGGMIDVAVVGIACAGFVWALWVRPATTAQGLAAEAGLPGLALLLVTGAMVGLMLRAWITASGGRPTLSLLTVAVVCVFGGNLGLAVTAADPAGHPPALELCWITANLALAAAVLHPAAAHVVLPARAPELSRRRIAVLGAALAAFPALDVVASAIGRPIDSTLISLANLVLVPLVIVRLTMLARWTAVAEGRLRELRTQDELTGLPNRRAVTEHLAELLDRVAEGTSPGAALLFCDLDDFTAVNDELGYRTGDALLVEVASRLRGAARGNGVVARFGGDEFLLVLEGEPDAVRAAGLSSVERLLEPPAHLDRVMTSARASIGTAVVRPGERVSVDHLLGTADASMARVKRARRADRAAAAARA